MKIIDIKDLDKLPLKQNTSHLSPFRKEYEQQIIDLKENQCLVITSDDYPISSRLYSVVKDIKAVNKLNLACRFLKDNEGFVIIKLPKETKNVRS